MDSRSKVKNHLLLSADVTAVPSMRKTKRPLKGTTPAYYGGIIVMSLRKRIILGVSILALLVIVIVFSGETNMRPERALSNFANKVEKGNIDNISLTIYYVYPSFTTFPLKVDDVIRTRDYEIVVSGKELREHIDLLKRISGVNLIPYNDESYLEARIYYIFKSGNRKIFDVTMWGSWESVFINGAEFYMNDIFIDVIIPFLPERAAEILSRYKEP